MSSRRGAAVPLLAAAVLALAACSDDGTEGTSVFAAKPGQCFLAPEDVEAQISELERVACSQPHQHEAYALVPYTPADPEADAEEFPGDKALTDFADGACATEFRDYVGIDYLDSELYFTYLLPSPRSWQDEDRSVLCLITSAGGSLSESVKDSAR